MQRDEMIRVNGAIQPRTTFVAPVEFGLRTGDTVVLKPEEGAGSGKLLALVESMTLYQPVGYPRIVGGILQILASLDAGDRLGPITEFGTFLADVEPVSDVIGRAYYNTVDAVTDPVTKKVVQPAALAVGELLTNNAVPVSVSAAGFNRHTALLAQSGAGKSYALGVIIEELLSKTGARIVVVDPNGDFSRLLSLPESDGMVLVESRDPQRYRSASRRLSRKGVRGLTFNLNMLEPVLWEAVLSELVALLWERRDDRRATVIVVDEAHNFIPADGADGVAARVLMKIAAEGRKYGLWLLLASQRPQKLHGNVITQCDNLIVMRITSQNDLDHIAGSFGAIDRGMLHLAASFRSGSAMVVGRIVKSPTLMRFRERRMPEAGGDISLTWACSLS